MAAGLPGTARVIGVEEERLPALPRIALSLSAADAEPLPAVALLASILRETLSETLHALQIPA